MTQWYIISLYKNSPLWHDLSLGLSWLEFHKSYSEWIDKILWSSVHMASCFFFSVRRSHSSPIPNVCTRYYGVVVSFSSYSESSWFGSCTLYWLPCLSLFMIFEVSPEICHDHFSQFFLKLLLIMIIPVLIWYCIVSVGDTEPIKNEETIVNICCLFPVISVEVYRSLSQWGDLFCLLLADLSILFE